MVADLAKAISLSDEQEEKVSDLYFEHFDKVAEQQEKSQGSRGSGREAMQKLNADLEENAILLQRLLGRNEQAERPHEVGVLRHVRAPGGLPQPGVALWQERGPLPQPAPTFAAAVC